MTPKLHTLLFAAFMAGALSGCGCTHIDAGHVGVEVVSCGDGTGVNQTPVAVGYHFTGPCTTIEGYPVYVQNVVWSHNITEGNPVNEEITFTNADQMQIAADISLAYQLDPAKVPAFYAKFRSDDLKTFTDGFLRNMAREKFDESAGKYKVEQIMGDNAKFLAEVRAGLQREVEPYGVKIIQFGFIGAPRPPENVIQAINAKLAATQKSIQVENELRQAEAEGRKRVAQADADAKAEIAKAQGDAAARRLAADAEAYANKTITSSLTQELVEYRKVQKWDGKLPQVQSGSGAGTLLQLGK